MRTCTRFSSARMAGSVDGAIDGSLPPLIAVSDFRFASRLCCSFKNDWQAVISFAVGRRLSNCLNAAATKVGCGCRTCLTCCQSRRASLRDCDKDRSLLTITKACCGTSSRRTCDRENGSNFMLRVVAIGVNLHRSPSTELRYTKVTSSRL